MASVPSLRPPVWYSVFMCRYGPTAMQRLFMLWAISMMFFRVSSLAWWHS